MDLDVVWCIFGVRPSQDSICCRVKNLLSVGSNKVGCERYVERVVDDGVSSLWRGYGRSGLGGILGMLIHGVHGHIRTAHAKVGAHPLGPVTHVRQLIHGGEQRTEGRRIERSSE